MNTKSILYFSLLIIGLVLSLGLVCASENIMDNQEATTVADGNYGGALSAGENDNLKVDIEAPDVNIVGPEGKLKGPKFKMPDFKGEGPEVDVNLPKADIDISGPKAPMPNFYNVDGILGEQYVEQQQQGQSSLVIEKFWENNDSGSITYVEIEVYRIIKGSQVQEQHVEQQQQAGEHDILAEPMFITIDGVEKQVELVGRYNITKDNGWKLTLDNLFFYSYYDYDAHQLKTDYFTYFVKEVNLPDNVFPVYSNLSGYTDNADGLSVYWNLTNSIIPDEPVLGDEPPEEEVNETPEENEPETPAVDNSENPEVEDNSTEEITVEENKTSPTVEQSSSSAGEKKVLDVENATGNPLVLLLMVIAVLGVVVRRRD